jgi:chromosome partitioning protein
MIENETTQHDVGLDAPTVNSLSAISDVQTTPLSTSYLLSQNELADFCGITSNAISIQATKLGIKSQRIRNRAAFSSVSTRQLLTSRGFTYPKETISFQMLKGGSTKTSSLYNLAVRLNQYGARVLAIDLDMQGNLTDAFGVDVGERPVFVHVAQEDATLEEAIVPISENLDLIPSDFENSTLDFYLITKRVNTKTYMRDLLAAVRDRYDFILVDCNPALSSLNIAIALASDRVIIPVNPDKFASKGLRKTVEELERVGHDHESTINYNLLFTLFDGREASSQKYLIDYGSNYKGKLISSVIRRNADVKNAFDLKRSIFDYAKAPAREDFDAFARSVLRAPSVLRGNA